MMGIGGDMRDETDLDYCPACGSELEGEFPVECPECGPVNIDFWPSPWESGEAEEIVGDPAEDLDDLMETVGELEGLMNLMGADVGENDYDDRDAHNLTDEDLADILDTDKEDIRSADDERGGIRDRINNVLGWR